MNLAQILPTITTSLILISAIFVACGWYQIRQGNKETHRKLMITGATFALVFFVIYMSRTVFMGNMPMSEDAPDWIRTSYFIFLIFHILLATISGVFGIITLLHAFNERFEKHKKIGRWTATLWLFTAPTGTIVYILLYVMYPSDVSASLWKAIMG